MKTKLNKHNNIYYVKQSVVTQNINEKVFVVFNSINNHVDMMNYDYMKHILRFGSLYSISEARVSRTCILLNLEYNDQRNAEELKSNLNCSFLEGAQIMVYNAVSNDEILCPYQQKNGNVAIRHPFLSINTIKLSSDSNHYSMAATPLPSPVAETHSYFSTDPYAMKYTQIPSLPPSPIALQHNITKDSIVIGASPSSSTDTADSTSVVIQEGCASYATIAQSLPTATTSPSPSPSNSNDAKKKKLDKVPSVSARSTSQKKKIPNNTKKTVSNSVDFDKIQAGQDKRTTFMIRNIPNKYTQQMLIDYVNATHKNKYDFLYLRIDFQNKCNVGYAFINFIDPRDAVSFANERVGKKWKLFKSDKKCDLSYANIQGKEALIKKFQNSQVLSEDIAYQPKLFYSSGSRAGQEQPWPNSNSNKSRSKD